MSGLAGHVADYLALRRALGHQLDDAARLLPRFVAFLDERHLATVTIQAAMDWCTGPAPRGGATVAPRRMTAVRGFANYLSGIDPATEIPPIGLIRSQQHRTTPFVYTDADIAAMLGAAHRLSGDRLRNQTYYTLIGLLAVTGLRIGEAIKLDLADIDHAERVLLIRESKFGKSRLVPIQVSTMSAIDTYLQIRATKPGAGQQPAVFVSGTGRRLCYQCVRQTFQKIVTEAGVGHRDRRPPHLHDLRHRFAIATLRDWYAHGDDVQAKLPALSTYLGHREPASTYWYLTATADLLAAAAGRQHLGWAQDPS
jgi:integrase